MYHVKKKPHKTITSCLSALQTLQLHVLFLHLNPAIAICGSSFLSCSVDNISGYCFFFLQSPNVASRTPWKVLTLSASALCSALTSTAAEIFWIFRRS